VAHRHVRNRAGIDPDGSPFPILNSVDMIPVDQRTEELQLLGDTLNEWLHYIPGGFLFKESGMIAVTPIISGAPRNNREATGRNQS